MMIILAVLLTVAQEPAASRTSIVEVNGARYRVTTKGEYVTVAKKAMVVHFDMAERDAQREAVTKATGCKVTDELQPNDARLRGKLDCAK